MTIFKKVLLASALTMSLAAPALAVDSDALTLQERNVYLFMDGKMVHTPVSEATQATVLKEFKPLKSGTMVYVSGGKFYIGENKKMADGKMLHTMIFGRDLGSANGW
ncbi:MAG TPA: hypothetical protein VFB45_21210 [Pseudolabrys sp.]|nr:hypothetical protein [Pseudolabrys sp.]